MGDRTILNWIYKPTLGSHLVLGMIWNNPHMDANGQQLGMVHHREPARHAQSYQVCPETI